MDAQSAADQRSAISDQRSAISDQRSAISDQRSAISDQPNRRALRRVVEVALGALLLTAGALKTYGLSVSPLPSVGGLSVPAVQYSVVTWEFVLGSLLVLGAFRPLPWILAIGTFFAFAVVSGYLGLIGQASCGCFGAIKASPWAAFAVDLVAVAALVIARPNRIEWHNLYVKTIFIAVTKYAIGSAMFIAITILGMYHFFGSIDKAISRLRGIPISSPAYVDFGTAIPGERVERTISISNYTNRIVRLTGGTTDCSCITTTSMPVSIPPNENQNLTIFFLVPKSNVGEFTRSVEIWTDLEELRTIQFRVGCRVAAPE